MSISNILNDQGELDVDDLVTNTIITDSIISNIVDCDDLIVHNTFNIVNLTSDHFIYTVLSTTGIIFITSQDGNFIQIGNIVHCYGRFRCEIQAVNLKFDILGINLPIPKVSNFSGTDQPIGVCNATRLADFSLTGNCTGVLNSTVRFDIVNSGQLGTDCVMCFNFSYNIN